MKKLFLLGFLAVSSTCLFAQTTPPDKKQDMKEVRTDVVDLKKDEVARKADLKAGDKAAAKAVTTDIRADKKELGADVKNAKQEGIKHPIHRAKRQIHKHIRKH